MLHQEHISFAPHPHNHVPHSLGILWLHPQNIMDWVRISTLFIPLSLPLPPCSLYPIYPLAPKETQSMDEYIEETLKQGSIYPSTTPLLTGVFFMLKNKGGHLRPCINYRGLNQVPSNIHIPCLWSPLHWNSCERPKYSPSWIYAVLIIWSLFERVLNGRHFGHYEYCTMPYGLSWAAALFQCLINDVLCNMLGKFVIAYI